MAGDMGDGIGEVMEHGIGEDIMAVGIITMGAAIITRVLDITLISPIIMEDIIHTHFTMDTMLNLPGTEKHARITQARR